MPALRSNWLTFHVLTVFLGYGRTRAGKLASGIGYVTLVVTVNRALAGEKRRLTATLAELAPGRLAPMPGLSASFDGVSNRNGVLHGGALMALADNLGIDYRTTLGELIARNTGAEVSANVFFAPAAG